MYFTEAEFMNMECMAKHKPASSGKKNEQIYVESWQSGTWMQ